MLREMIESGRLSRGVPVREGGRVVTRVIERDGPIAYSESTTAASVDEEDANRCLILTTDEGQGQTRRILRAPRRRPRGEPGPTSSGPSPSTTPSSG